MSDSTEATLTHIGVVQDLGGLVVKDFVRRLGRHDHSKLLPPEKACFDEISVRLRGTPYGSQGYRETLREFKPALDHHQTKNDHHPEAHPRGIHSMNLIQLLELCCDWIAASRRHPDGDVLKSLVISQERFGMTDDETALLERTIHYILDLEGSA